MIIEENHWNKVLGLWKKIQKSLATLMKKKIGKKTYQYQEWNKGLSWKNLQRPKDKGIL